MKSIHITSSRVIRVVIALYVLFAVRDLFAVVTGLIDILGHLVNLTAIAGLAWLTVTLIRNPDLLRSLPARVRKAVTDHGLLR